MKTSILISSIAALCLLVTFAEAPRRHGEDKMKAASTGNISIPMVNTPVMLPGVEITNFAKKEALIAVPVIPSEDFIYLKFDVNKYMEADADIWDKSEVMPEAIETDFSYLKFDVNKYMEADADTWDKPEVLPEAIETDFSYLKFHINYYTTDPEFTGEEMPE